MHIAIAIVVCVCVCVLCSISYYDLYGSVCM